MESRLNSWPDDHSQGLVFGEVGNCPVVHRFNPVAVIDQGKQMYKQPHYPGYKTSDAHFWFRNVCCCFAPTYNCHGAFIIVCKWHLILSTKHCFKILRQVFALLNSYLRQLRMSLLKILVRSL